jgi:hypothetical protein
VIKECTVREFGMGLSYESWTNVFNISDDVNLMFNNFLNTYPRIFNYSFPYKMYYSHKNKLGLLLESKRLVHVKEICI